MLNFDPPYINTHLTSTNHISSSHTLQVWTAAHLNFTDYKINNNKVQFSSLSSSCEPYSMIT